MIYFSIDPTGEFYKRQRSLAGGYIQINAEDLIKAELVQVRTESERKYQKLKIAHNTHIGLELLHLFVLDLLGRTTPVAKIFRTKTEEEYISNIPFAHILISFRHSMVVTTMTKVFAWIIVVLINFFFIFFSILRGLERGYAWQRLFLMACVFRMFSYNSS